MRNRVSMIVILGVFASPMAFAIGQFERGFGEGSVPCTLSSTTRKAETFQDEGSKEDVDAKKSGSISKSDKFE